ncbi:MAG TPA: dihydrofolate reductase family protein [Terriglobales bacterium]|nr:dihydrofolate reductase family protein [Terriglobales bacterium]
MRKIVVSAQVSANGVEENPQRFSFDYTNEEFMKYASEQLFASDALIMGRMTYEGFAQAWPASAGANAFADRMNGLPKYVASRTLNGPLTWNANLIQGDIAAEVAKIKQQPGGDILQYGIGELTYTLLQHGLIDEIRLLMYPVVISGGHIFETIDKTPLNLLESRSFSNGVMVLHYQPTNRA